MGIVMPIISTGCAIVCWFVVLWPIQWPLCLHKWAHMESECGITGKEQVGDLNAVLHFERFQECGKCRQSRFKKTFEGTRCDATAFFLGRPSAGNNVAQRNTNGRAAGYSGCARCGGTWDWKRGHSTWYKGGDGTPDSSGFSITGFGVSPLCEECWAALSPEKREPYYNQLVDAWHRWDKNEEDYRRHESDRPLILAAVREGK